MDKTKDSLWACMQKKTVGDVPFGGIPPFRHVLVLAPHHDDEALGCGGTLLRYLEKGAQVTLIYLTDGRYGVERGKDAVRKAEAQAAWQDYPEVRQFFWDFEDSNLDAEKVKEYLADALKSIKPDIVFTPWIFDRHRDHRMTSTLLGDVLEQDQDFNGTVAFYEVLYPLFANHTVNITRQFGRKLQIIDAYESQIRLLNIKEAISSLNLFRAHSIQLKTIQAAEAFFLCDKAVFLNFIKGVV